MDPYPGSLSSAPRTPASPVFSVPTSEGTHTPGEQRSPLAVGQKAGVTHHLLKMPRWNVAKITPEHLSLAQRLPFMYASRAVVIQVMMDHRATAVVTQA